MENYRRRPPMEGFSRPGSLGGEAWDDEDSVEGHIMGDDRTKDQDVEGHAGRWKASDDDTEGHAVFKADEGAVFKADDDDTEGHAGWLKSSEDEDDTEGHANLK